MLDIIINAVCVFSIIFCGAMVFIAGNNMCQEGHKTGYAAMIFAVIAIAAVSAWIWS